MKKRSGLIAVTIILIVIIGLGTVGFTQAEEADQSKNEFKEYWPSKKQARIKLIESISSFEQRKKKEEEGFFAKVSNFLFGKEENNVTLQRPFGLSSFKKELYITDPAGGAVYRMDFAEKKLERFLYQSEGSFFSEGEKYFKSPIDVVTDGEKIFVSDSVRQEVFVFSKDGDLIEKLGQKTFERPTGLGIAKEKNRVYIADTVQNKIYVYDTESYELVNDFGQRGNKSGEFNYPVDIFVRDEKIYISDSMNFRIQIFDLTGNFISEFGRLGNSSGDFARPKGVAVDSEGHIYVVDALFGVVQIFNQEGQLLLTIGEEGRKPGQFKLPAGIYIDGKDKIYVADSYNHRVQIFKYLGQ